MRQTQNHLWCPFLSLYKVLWFYMKLRFKKWSSLCYLLTSAWSYPVYLWALSSFFCLLVPLLQHFLRFSFCKQPTINFLLLCLFSILFFLEKNKDKLRRGSILEWILQFLFSFSSCLLHLQVSYLLLFQDSVLLLLTSFLGHRFQQFFL